MDNDNETTAENNEPELEQAEQQSAVAVEEQPVAEQPAAEQPAPEGDQPAVVPVELSEEERHAHVKKALESLLFITDHPLTLAQLCKMVGVPQKQSKKVVAIIDELRAEMEAKGSAVQIVEVADGFQMGTKPVFAPYVKKLYSEKMTMRLSTAAHETLAIISYKQPLTRAEIEQIRGVEVIAAIETLLEKRLIEVVGRRETVGRPLLYGTTVEFLRHFGLRSLEDLPPIDSFVVENAPLGAQPTPGEAALEAPVPMVEATENDDLPTEGEQKRAACAEAAAKEFEAGEQIAAEKAAEAAEAVEPQEAGTEEQPEGEKRKTIWD